MEGPRLRVGVPVTASPLDERCTRAATLGLAVTYSPTTGWGTAVYMAPERAGEEEERAPVRWVGGGRGGGVMVASGGGRQRRAEEGSGEAMSNNDGARVVELVKGLLECIEEQPTLLSLVGMTIANAMLWRGRVAAPTTGLDSAPLLLAVGPTIGLSSEIARRWLTLGYRVRRRDWPEETSEGNQSAVDGPDRDWEVVAPPPAAPAAGLGTGPNCAACGCPKALLLPSAGDATTGLDFGAALVPTPCAYCGEAAPEGHRTVRRDGWNMGPLVPLCAYCSSEVSLREIWDRISQADSRGEAPTSAVEAASAACGEGWKEEKPATPAEQGAPLCGAMLGKRTEPCALLAGHVGMHDDGCAIWPVAKQRTPTPKPAEPCAAERVLEEALRLAGVLAAELTDDAVLNGLCRDINKLAPLREVLWQARAAPTPEMFVALLALDESCAR